MADEALTTRDLKLIQYLNEAYGKEKELETALQAHIRMTKRAPYKKRLQDHLKETKAQAKGLERRIKALGGKAERAAPVPVPVPGPEVALEAASAVTAVASQAMAAAKGPMHALRGTSEAEKQLKNAKTELWNEYEEIGNYTAIETLAEALNDDETVKLAREYRRQEERMANFLLKQIPTLTKAVVTAEIPAAERRPAAASRSASSSRSRSGSAGSAASSSSRGSGRSRAASGSRSSGSATRSSSRSSASSSRSPRSSGASSRSSGASSRSSGASSRSGRSRSPRSSSS
jgi:ferritin-like metal-binding protein YciE